jgi:hypothetical protein
VIYGAFGSVNPPGLTGDYNNNGIVDAADYVVWRKHSNTNVTLPNDPLGGTIGSAQYNQWRSRFGQTLSGSGSGGGPGSGIQAVPEPTAAALLLVGIMLAGASRRRG